MTRTITFIAVVGAALIAAAPGWGKGQPLVADPATEAQILRGQELDRHYGLGSSSTSSPARLEPNVGARGLTDDPASRVGSTSEVSSGSEIDWAQVGVGGGIGLLLAVGLVAAMRFTRIRQLGH